MANQKLDQIYGTNPALTLGNSDLIYIMQSPYSAGTDAAMIGSVFKSLFAPLTTKGDIYTYSTTNTRLAVGSDSQMLQANSAAATGLSWSTATYPSSTTANQLLYSSSNNVIGGLASAANAVLVTSAGSVPSLSTTLPSGLTIPGYQTTITPSALTKTDDTNVTLTLGGTPDTALLQETSLTLGWTGQLAVARGGTGLASATAYAVLCGGTTSTGAFQSIASVGTSGQVLTSNGAGALPTFQTPSSAVIVAGTGINSMKTTFGNDATATRGIRIGIDPSDPTSAVIGDDGIGIGSCSYVGTNAVVIGKDARGQGTDAICLGNTAKAGAGFGGGSKSIAIGYLASTSTQDNALMLTTTSSQPPTPSATGEWVLSSGARMRFYINGTQAVNIGADFDLINMKGTADQSYSLQAPTTGFNITIGAGVKSLILNPAGTLATGTITMPASPIDGQEIRVSTSNEVTALTVSANAGQTISNAPTTLLAGTGFSYIYNLSGTNWYRIY